MHIIKKTYDNIIQLATENDLYQIWAEETGREKLEDYFDDYSDRDIVNLFLSDMIGSDGVEWESVGKMGEDWRNQKIIIL